jgi:Ca2+-binding RTX toxin-like protein
MWYDIEPDYFAQARLSELGDQHAAFIAARLVVFGGGGADQVQGSADGDLVAGEGGNDTLIGNAGEDTLSGGDGADLLYGNAGNDTLFGDAGPDVIYGGQDKDLISAGEGDDILFGNRGDDILAGGAGNDTLVGGDGRDIFVFDPAAGFGSDLVTDFDVTADSIQVAGTVTVSSGTAGAVLSVAGHTITLAGVDASLVTAGLFFNGNTVVSNIGDGVIDIGDFEFR